MHTVLTKCWPTWVEGEAGGEQEVMGGMHWETVGWCCFNKALQSLGVQREEDVMRALERQKAWLLIGLGKWRLLF